MKQGLSLLAFICLASSPLFSQTITTSAIVGSPFCAGAAVNVPYTITGVYNAGNVFTAQLSDAAGAFGTPVVIGTLSSTLAGTVSAQILTAQATGAGYRIRVVSSNPVVTGVANTVNLTINALNINAPTFAGITFCQGASLTVNFVVPNGCSLPNSPANNIFTAQLSNSAGSFASPTNIGTSTAASSGAISTVIPVSTPAGLGYRIRVTSSNPGAGLTSADNGTNLTVNAIGLNAPTFAGTTFCQGVSFTLTYSFPSGCVFQTGNSFTAQLSDAAGSFGSPIAIGTNAATAAGNFLVTVPVGTPAGLGYRIRVIGSNPSIIGPDNGVNLTINAIGLNKPTFALTTYCQGAAFTLTYTYPSGCAFQAGNVFSAQLSDIFGGFSSPTIIGTSTTTTAGNFTVTIPVATAAGNAYRIRIVGSNPSVISLDNGTNITINAFGVSAPVLPLTSFCQGQTFSLTYAILNACSFPNTPSNNIFTAQLSDASGSFTSPTAIGNVTTNNSGTISATVPLAQAAGGGYRIRIISSNPGAGLTSPDNGTNLTIAATAGTPSVFGNGVWNAYVYNSNNFANYSGFYTENNLGFNTTTRFLAANAPSTADASSGLAYTGCSVNVSPWSISYKRTNFVCGYYQIDIPSHDDNVTLFVNGVQVYTAVCCTANLTAVWSGFVGAASTIEFQIINTGGPGNLQVNFNALANPITVTPPVTICASSSTVLTASSSVPLTFAWTPTTGLTPVSGVGSSVTAQPAVSTVYTVTGTDAATSCTVTKTVAVAVTNVFTTAVSATLATICSGVNSSTLTATGANTYTWSPSAGLSATTGPTVTANPATTTLYTVTGTNGCTSNNASVTVTVQTIPAAPPTTTFGNAVWNIFCNNNTTLSNYYGYYTENNLSFNTTTRWNANSGPSIANATTGSAYSGCTFGGVQYSMSLKRTNFTCGYYQIDVAYQDDAFTLLLNGVQVFQNNAFSSTLQTNVWSGFLGPSSQLEMQLVNFNGPGQLQVSIHASAGSPQTLSPAVTICAGTSTALTATAVAYPSATYSWSVSPTDPTISFVPSNTVSSPVYQTTALTPSGNYTVTNILTDVGNTNCTANATVLIIVNPLPTTAVTPINTSTYCPSAGIVLTATGANTYTWSPTTNLSASSGFQVTATPTSTVTYTVTGNNNCSSNTANATITVLPLPAITIFPTNTWNVYGFNSTTVGTNFQGFYSENGNGSGYDFNTTARWASGAAPSTANATNGTAWQGCVMPATNFSLSFKRSNFTCGVYQVNVVYHDDNFVLLINGTTVAQHIGCCDIHTAIWTGVLNSASTVEWQLVQGTGGSALQVQFVPVVQTASVWSGALSTDWFTVGNWCTAVPTSSTDAVIFSSGPQNMPAIGAAGAQVRNITINGAIVVGTYNTAIAAASLTTSANNNLDEYGNWVNNGTYTANSGSVSFLGTNAGNTISNFVPTPFYNVILNKTNPITNISGIMQVSNLLTFTTGVLIQSASVNVLNGASVTGASNTSYVDGLITKTGNSQFTFPVGKGGFYRPIALSAPALVTDNFTAQYFNTNPNGTYPNAQRVASIDHVSGAEYWFLNRSGGASNVSVTLSWSTNSGGVGSLGSLRVARWDVTSAKWINEGTNGAPTGNTTTGTVTSAVAVSTFSSPNSPFTLASADNFNVLPVELTDFSCLLKPPGIVTIKWTTQSEINNDHFDVERSTGATSFVKIASESGAGTSTQIHQYLFEDVGPPAGKIYYRLRQVDVDGRFTYSEVELVDNPYASSVTLYPNPTDNSFSINLNGCVMSAFSLTDMMEHEIKVPFTIDREKITVDISSLPNGIYLVAIVLDGQVYRLRSVVER